MERLFSNNTNALASIVLNGFWCHSLVPLSGVTLWTHSDKLDELGKLDKLDD